MKNIKQIVLSSLFALLITSNLMAQNTITKPFTIKAGYQQTNLDGDNIDFLSVDGKTTVLNSFLIGIAYHSEISKFISFKHELNFNINGAKVTLNDAINGDYQSTLRMNSLQLQPLNVTFRIKGFQVYVGTYTSALLHASIKRKDELENTYKDKSIFLFSSLSLQHHITN